MVRPRDHLSPKSRCAKYRSPCEGGNVVGRISVCGGMRAIPVDVVGLHVEASTGAPLVLLRERASPHRVVPIFIGKSEATSIAIALSGQSAPRPLTHDLMAALVDRLDVHVDSVEVTDLVDGAFIATLNLSGATGGRR